MMNRENHQLQRLDKEERGILMEKDYYGWNKEPKYKYDKTKIYKSKTVDKILAIICIIYEIYILINFIQQNWGFLDTTENATILVINCIIIRILMIFFKTR